MLGRKYAEDAGLTLHAPSAVNPYTQWIHHHPQTLLPRPTPEAVRTWLARTGQGPVVVDLGCGSGNFLLRQALQCPGYRFVGLEVRYKRLVKAARKCEKAGLANVLLLRALAERFAACFPAGSLHAVWINFPDPWPKRAQWKKRLVSAAFLDDAARTLAPGGRLHLKTDHSGYFLHVLDLLRGRRGLHLLAYSNDLHRHRLPEAGVPTEFEQLFRAQRRPVFFLLLEKPRVKG